MELTFPPITNSIDIVSFGRWFRVITAPLSAPTLTVTDAKIPNMMHQYAELLERRFSQAPNAKCVGICLVFAPQIPLADIAVAFWTGDAFSPIPELFLLATAKELVQRKLVVPAIDGLLKYETPAGLVQVNYSCDKVILPDRKTTRAPVFLDGVGLEIHSAAIGKIRFDVVFSCGFYAIVSPDQALLERFETDPSILLEQSKLLYDAICQQFDIFHSGQPRIHGIKKIVWNLPEAPQVFEYSAGQFARRPVCGNTVAALLLRNALLQTHKPNFNPTVDKTVSASIEEYIVSHERPGAIVLIREADIGYS
ncbi:MAG: proline racemase family protein [Paracoccaceae bacterium]